MKTEIENTESPTLITASHVHLSPDYYEIWIHPNGNVERRFFRGGSPTPTSAFNDVGVFDRSELNMIQSAECPGSDGARKNLGL
jgi:hypothetical protein